MPSERQYEQVVENLNDAINDLSVSMAPYVGRTREIRVNSSMLNLLKDMREIKSNLQDVIDIARDLNHMKVSDGIKDYGSEDSDDED